jgi:hypothetical protein
MEQLKDYVFRTRHVEVFQKKKFWINPEVSGPGLACWWIDEGEMPTLSDSAKRLRLIRDRGPTADAFCFSSEAGGRPGT